MHSSSPFNAHRFHLVVYHPTPWGKQWKLHFSEPSSWGLPVRWETGRGRVIRVDSGLLHALTAIVRIQCPLQRQETWFCTKNRVERGEGGVRGEKVFHLHDRPSKVMFSGNFPRKSFKGSIFWWMVFWRPREEEKKIMSEPKKLKLFFSLSLSIQPPKFLSPAFAVSTKAGGK